ncbi:SGNH/GDSL hydrolase family protein [Echinicola shivajiensis]|uniref:SGNH/GDSL hydrolase family protein n=1 Tax=Echinicola shivajiensis TaxID=1035916 RepID=UPI001BFC7366|nr:SGNH/GDSL hydrolase family protein [Echinicola shivajiensis]
MINKLRLVGLFLLVLVLKALVPTNGFAQQVVPKDTVNWNGFERVNLELDGRSIRIISPKSSLEGKPWLWRARFPDWHTEQDLLLLEEGFHVVYIDTDFLYGSPHAVEIWDQLYQWLVNKKGFNPKPALSGVSRGGLFVYNWAKKNPDKVACIYAEAPVCDFKSWPGGQGKGKGSEEDWERLKSIYGFTDEKAAQDYNDNPIDGLEGLAENKVPILHMIGLEDQVVPPEENTFVLVDRYTKLGGPATLVPCTEGEQDLYGHHFPIESPRLVADFVKYYAAKGLKLSSSDFYDLRKGLKNSQIKFEKTKKGRVAFLGGSITYNHGWRDSVMNYIQERFPETDFEFIAAGIPSMGTVPGAFRLERDILSKGPVDLLFEEAAVNDESNGRSNSEQIRGMEGIVRHVRKTNPSADIVLFHFVDPDKIETYNNGGVPEVIKNHESVAEHYDLPSLNLAKEVTMRIAYEEFTWEDDFKNLHPSPFGQQIYAQSMIDMLDAAYSGHLDPDDKFEAHPLPEKLDEGAFDNGKLLEAESFKNTKTWVYSPSWEPNDGKGTRANYVKAPMLLNEGPGSKLKINFEGNAVGIAVAAGPDAGMISYRIDGGEWKSQDLFTRWSSGLHLPWYYVLGADLEDGGHRLELKVLDQKNPNSTGNAVRIRYFFINQ